MSNSATPELNSSSYPPTAAPGVADLLLRVCDGDPAAWEEIVHRYGKLVYAMAHSFRLQDADALDAVQTTWLRLAEHAHQIHARYGKNELRLNLHA